MDQKSGPLQDLRQASGLLAPAVVRATFAIGSPVARPVMAVSWWWDRRNQSRMARIRRDREGADGGAATMIRRKPNGIRERTIRDLAAAPHARPQKSGKSGDAMSLGHGRLVAR